MILCTSATQAQVLWNETFDNYILGNVGTDPTGATPGQGGWYTEEWIYSKNSFFVIENETNKGKALTLNSSTTPPYTTAVSISRKNLNTLIDQRTTGCNVIKLELNYYTGAQHNNSTSSSTHQRIILYGNNGANSKLVSFSFQSSTGEINANCEGQTKMIYLDNNPNNQPNYAPKLPFNTWVTLIVYLDYNNKKAYFETPYFNKIAVADFLVQSTSTNLIDDFKPSRLLFSFGSENNTTQVFNKYDNIKLTALKNVPLSINEVLATKFNVYPNPATNVVNINSAENKPVSKVVVYDVAGKLLSTQSFNNETNIQLNTESLASGTYMLHIETAESTAVKKLVKK